MLIQFTEHVIFVGWGMATAQWVLEGARFPFTDFFLMNMCKSTEQSILGWGAEAGQGQFLNL